MTGDGDGNERTGGRRLPADRGRHTFVRYFLYRSIMPTGTGSYGNPRPSSCAGLREAVTMTSLQSAFPL